VPLPKINMMVSALTMYIVRRSPLGFDIQTAQHPQHPFQAFFFLVSGAGLVWGASEISEVETSDLKGEVLFIDVNLTGCSGPFLMKTWSGTIVSMLFL
jgi:hypothetical protein